MLNRPTNRFDENPGGDLPWQVDRNPGVRLLWLLAAMLLPLLLVGARLVYLQAFLADDFAVSVNRTTESFEPIPSPDGRILASDGRVLAYDIVRFNVRMHYRWLEEPADRDWLRNQALARLSQSQRRNSLRIDAEEQRVLASREKMWHQLARLSGMGSEELRRNRFRCQRRVERIVASVRRRRREQHRREQGQALRVARPEASEGRDLRRPRRRKRGQVQFVRSTLRAVPANWTSPLFRATLPWWQRAWRIVSTSLTTAPQRRLREPQTVVEQFDYHTVVENVSRLAAIEIEAHPERFPGLRVEMTTKRAYPEKSLAPHVIGVRTRISEEELKRRRRRFPDGDPLDYRAGDRIGKTGVERTYDRHLRGLRGWRKIVKDRRGEVIRTEVDREPRIGRDVILTLNLPLQERAEQLLDDALAGTASPDEETAEDAPHGGCIVAIDVHTGAVFAAASAPRYDLNLFVNPDSDRWKQLLDDPRRPFFPRVTQMTLPPGSVFKTLTSIAVLESKKIDPDEPIHCQGFLDTPERHRCYIYRHYGVGHGDMNLSDAICRSCNVYFFTAARKMGANPIVDWAGRFGFGRPTGIDLPGERGGNLPAPPPAEKGTGPICRNGPKGASHKLDLSPFPQASKSHEGDALGLAIGQSRLTATPLQVARLMAAVANDGYLVTPHVVRDAGPVHIDDERSNTFGIHEPRRIPGLSPGTLERVREGLRRVVEHPLGTGYKRVRLKQIAIAGKTGTAEVAGGKQDHAWFAGYVPADRPRIAFVVVLEHGGPGGKVAGPIARSLVEAMLELGILEPGRLSTGE